MAIYLHSHISLYGVVLNDAQDNEAHTVFFCHEAVHGSVLCAMQEHSSGYQTVVRKPLGSMEDILFCWRINVTLRQTQKNTGGSGASPFVLHKTYVLIT
jgi:hypothetical protein